MPLFGKKSKEDSKNKEAPGSGYQRLSHTQGYPTQPQAYPTQPQAYPTQPQGYPTHPQGYPAQPIGYPCQPAMQPTGAPPPYSTHPPPAHQEYGGAYAQAAPVYQPQQYQRPVAAPGTVVVQGGFEAGARFGAGAQPNVPPPPPGCAPNAAQMAVMQGQNVVVSQQSGGYMSGTGDGGYCIW